VPGLRLAAPADLTLSPPPPHLLLPFPLPLALLYARCSETSCIADPTLAFGPPPPLRAAGGPRLSPAHPPASALRRPRATHTSFATSKDIGPSRLQITLNQDAPDSPTSGRSSVRGCAVGARARCRRDAPGRDRDGQRRVVAKRLELCWIKLLINANAGFQFRGGC